MTLFANVRLKLLFIYLLLLLSSFSFEIFSGPTLAVSFPFSFSPNSHFRKSLGSLKEFIELSQEVAGPLGAQKVVKILYTRNPQTRTGQIYFLNTKRHSYHYDFATKILGNLVSLREFNMNYAGTGEVRKFNIGTLVYQPSLANGKILLEMWNGDTITPPYLKEFMDEIQDNLKFQTEIPFVFHPMGAQQEKEITLDQNKHNIPYITNEELYKGKSYQMLNSGVAYGYIKVIDDGKENDQQDFRYNHIVVFKKVPNDIGLVGGVVTEEFQTPLSHINVKSLNRGTINFSLKEATKVLAAYNDQPVKIEVSPTGYQISKLSVEEAEKQIANFWNQKRPKNKLRPVSNLNSSYAKGFLSFQEFFNQRPSRKAQQSMVRIFGAKATNLAAMTTIVPAKIKQQYGVDIPEGLAVPFDYFDEMMNLPQPQLDAKNPQRVATLTEMILEKLKEGNLLESDKLHSAETAKPILQSIREMMKRSQVPESLLKEFKGVLFDDRFSPLHQTKVARIRLRSSTNSEDLEGFNGAGLYESTGVSLYKKKNGVLRSDLPKTWEEVKADLIKEIPFVYSSVWNDRAFEEREWFHLSGEKHLDVKMGLALHNAFPANGLDGAVGELANGVALTKNINGTDNDFYQIYINGQHFDLSVTNPPMTEDLQKLGEDPKIPYQTEEILSNPFLLARPRNVSESDLWKYWSYEVTSKSSIKKGAPVFNDDPSEHGNLQLMETRRLTAFLQYLNDEFARIYEKDSAQFILDTEWKIYGSERKIWVKQARPLSLQR